MHCSEPAPVQIVKRLHSRCCGVETESGTVGFSTSIGPQASLSPVCCNTPPAQSYTPWFFVGNGGEWIPMIAPEGPPIVVPSPHSLLRSRENFNHSRPSVSVLRV